MLHCLDNIATFMEALPMDSPSNLWTTICNQFQTFLTKLPSVLPLKVEMLRHAPMCCDVISAEGKSISLCPCLLQYASAESDGCN